MSRNTLAPLLLTLLCGPACLGGEVGFLEDFALATDRQAALGQLIPGTEDYYYYHCLDFQNRGTLDEVDGVLELWIKRHKRTPRVVEIENRQALLRYGDQPRQSLDYLGHHLGLRFDHQRVLPGERPTLPTRLDPEGITREAFTARALKRHSRTLRGFEDRAMEWALDLGLGPDRRRHALSRLQRPDLSDLTRKIVADLKHSHSGGFGSLPVHGQLLLSQLDELLTLVPDILDNGNFVHVYLSKLWPSADTEWLHDPEERQEYLERLWSFASKLAPSHNSLKAHILYHRLVHDRRKGLYDRARFIEYLELPRAVPYLERDFGKRARRDGHTADLNTDFLAVTLLPAVGNEEPLVRDFLLHFFAEDDTYRPYTRYVDDGYLKRTFSEAKIVSGRGDMERWYSMLLPSQYQALKERVDLDFAPDSKTNFAPDQRVALDVWVKNVPSLIVKVFEINTLNYYTTHRAEIDTAVDLDGLVANREKTFRYEEPSLRRVLRHFEFPELDRRGTYVIDFIGGGKSSRALIRKGRLRYLVRSGTAGHVFTVLDESNGLLEDASIWIAGHNYEANESGRITAPFSNEPGRQDVILVRNGFATLESFEHQGEDYHLHAGIHVDREALLARRNATVVVRPSLTVNRVPVTLAVLEDPVLVIESTDRDGVSATLQIDGFKLHEGRESLHEFKVPERLATIRFALKGKVRNLSLNKHVELDVGRQFRLNGIDKTENLEDLHFGRADGAYFFEILGKTGEIREGRPVRIWIKHHDFRSPLRASLQTDARGRIALGELAGIESISAQAPDGTKHTWQVLADRCRQRSSIHGRVGRTIEVPYSGSAEMPLRTEFSLLEVRGGRFVRDWFTALDIEGGFVKVGGLPSGDYDLYLKESQRRISLRLTDGEARDGYVLAGYRQLELERSPPLQIVRLDVDDASLKVQLANADSFSRVHVVATRYVPEYAIFPGLNAVPVAELDAVTVPTPQSLYVVGRDLGDEYRYILERKYATKYPGNMLRRPGLLLNPWDIRSTDTGREQARMGGDFERLADDARAARDQPVRPPANVFSSRSAIGGFANLDFLGEQSVVLTNLRPDEDGVVTVPRSDLGKHTQIHVVAVSPENTVYCQAALPAVDMDFLDLRLADSFDPTRHFTEQKDIRFVEKGQALVLEDITTSEFEVYDALDKVHALFVSLSNNTTLVEFGFVLNWPDLEIDEKREKYSKYACHELNLFLYRKDPEFFEQVIRPHLANKMHKTFLDHWLLDDDVGDYVKPWAYEQLNIVERILLARRVDGESARTRRHVEDLQDLLPPRVEQLDQLFESALEGLALAVGDRFGVATAMPAAPMLQRDSKAVKNERSSRARGGVARKLAGVQEEEHLSDDEDDDSGLEDREEAMLESEDGEAEKRVAGRTSLYFDADRDELAAVRQLYRRLEPTREWVENNYYRLPIEQQNADLVKVNEFWRDYARFDGEGAFFSPHFAVASSSFTEMLLALAVLDLPFKAASHETEFDDRKFTLRPGSSMVVFQKEIREARRSDAETPVLVSQNIYRHGDRHVHVGNERFDKYVTDEFLVHAAYGAHVVITNPTSAPRKLEVLLQIPKGAIPIQNGRYTRSLRVRLEPYQTWTHDHLFYFPRAGTFPHYPVQVARDGEFVGSTAPRTFEVVDTPSKLDPNSWEYISQQGSEAAVLAYLDTHNLGRVELEKIAWRMRDAAFFGKVLALLEARHSYNHTLWSYGLHHDVPAATREVLQHADGFLRQCGSAIDCTLVKVDPVVRKTYQHTEYWPLVNARSHRLGERHTILNDRFFAQYVNLMKVLSCRDEFDDDDLMSVTYYLMLQDRIEEALSFFERVRPERLAARLQYDYCDTYLSLYSQRLRHTREVASRYREYPVDRWRKLFLDALNSLEEIDSGRAQVTDDDDRTQLQSRLAATEPVVEFEVESGKVTLRYANVKNCVVNYYKMDIELLFSRNPFVQRFSGQFTAIRPNRSDTLELDPGKTERVFDLPERFLNQNVLVEVAAAGVKSQKPHFSNALALQLLENYGQVKVADTSTGKPLAQVYVKVYGLTANGGVQFYKDGYTDLRGRFDYSSLSTDDITQVNRFALLVLSDSHGAVVREVDPPKR